MKREIKLGKVEKLVFDTIKKAKNPISTYELAKKAKVSWSTANTHCYKLKSLGLIDSKNEEIKIGSKRIVWWIS